MNCDDTSGVALPAPPDPCAPRCEPGGVCKTPECGRLRSSELMRLYGTGAAGVEVLPPGVAPSPEGFGKLDLTGIKRGAVRTAGVAPCDAVQAWQHEEDPARVISAIQKAQALRDGGASASSVKPYSVPLAHGVEGRKP